MKDKLITIAACMVFLAGAAIFCYPLAKNWYYDYNTSHVLDSYKNEIKELSKPETEKSETENAESEKTEAFPASAEQASEAEKIFPELHEEMVTYNQSIYENMQKDLTDPFSYESASFDLTEYGLSDNIIGYLSIPAMDVELPVYLGANDENLAKGAVHLGQTSMPIGGNNTNAVLAAHRGYQGIPMFRDIEKLKTGDLVTITTPWDTLTYQVFQTEIIFPDEINKILIQPGKDMLTLFTCHPYRQNSHRYVVYCERTFIKEAEVSSSTENTPSTSETVQPEAEKKETPSVSHTEDSLSSSRQQIFIDKYVPIAGILFLAVLFILCMMGLKKK